VNEYGAVHSRAGQGLIYGLIGDRTDVQRQMRPLVFDRQDQSEKGVAGVSVAGVSAAGSLVGVAG